MAKSRTVFGELTNARPISTFAGGVDFTKAANKIDAQLNSIASSSPDVLGVINDSNIDNQVRQQFLQESQQVLNSASKTAVDNPWQGSREAKSGIAYLKQQLSDPNSIYGNAKENRDRWLTYKEKQREKKNVGSSTLNAMEQLSLARYDMQGGALRGSQFDGIEVFEPQNIADYVNKDAPGWKADLVGLLQKGNSEIKSITEDGKFAVTVTGKELSIDDDQIRDFANKSYDNNTELGKFHEQEAIVGLFDKYRDQGLSDREAAEEVLKGKEDDKKAIKKYMTARKNEYADMLIDKVGFKQTTIKTKDDITAFGTASKKWELENKVANSTLTLGKYQNKTKGYTAGNSLKSVKNEDSKDVLNFFQKSGLNANKALTDYKDIFKSDGKGNILYEADSPLSFEQFSSLVKTNDKGIKNKSYAQQLTDYNAYLDMHDNAKASRRAYENRQKYIETITKDDDSFKKYLKTDGELPVPTEVSQFLNYDGEIEGKKLANNITNQYLKLAQNYNLTLPEQETGISYSLSGGKVIVPRNYYNEVSNAINNNLQGNAKETALDSLSKIQALSEISIDTKTGKKLKDYDDKRKEFQQEVKGKKVLTEDTELNKLISRTITEDVKGKFNNSYLLKPGVSITYDPSNETKNLFRTQNNTSEDYNTLLQDKEVNLTYSTLRFETDNYSGDEYAVSFTGSVKEDDGTLEDITVLIPSSVLQLDPKIDQAIKALPEVKTAKIVRMYQRKGNRGEINITDEVRRAAAKNSVFENASEVKVVIPDDGGPIKYKVDKGDGTGLIEVSQQQFYNYYNKDSFVEAAQISY